MKYSYYCTQNESEQTKQKLNKDPSKRCARMCMQRFKCDGWLHVSVDKNNSSQVILRITHYENHIPYTNISVSEKVEELIGSLVDLPATKIWDIILEKKLEGQLTQKQVYAHWAQHNESRWRLDNDQVLSARKVLEACEGIKVNVIDVPQERGISSLAFAFQEVLSAYGAQITEITMESTWKTNAAGYNLYGIVGEANGQALPLAFAFTASMDNTAEPGAKDHMIQSVLKHVREHCPNIHFAHTNKDKSEINAIHAVLPRAKSQLCYWHAIKYLQERVAEDKLPTKYDLRQAHQLFPFIDPTWAPGIAAPGIEDSVHEDDVDLDQDTDTPDPASLPSMQPLPSTCRPPVLLLVSHDGVCTPAWPKPPKVKKSDLPIFCPKEHREPIVEKFWIHLHQHPEIPFNDENFTHLTAAEIHNGAVKEMYTYCFENNLQQAWAYLWNRWYTPNQWKLWAQSPDDTISHLKTTMIVKSLWKNVKHCDLKDFNCPQLDLVTHIVLTSVLPRVKLTLATVCGL
ncbi:hypothetical protein DXG01_008891 [Tephrocybe rancida]|nr:hypothetical protein DXG01_008891 [Tephrocybe rancida]